MRCLVVLAVVACGKHSEPPPPAPHDAGVVAAVNADAAVTPSDAATAAAGPTVAQLAVGPHAACAVMSDGSARCWGDNADGELGDGTRKDSAQPVTPKVRGVKQLALGDAHACALLDDGSVACWGKIGYAATQTTLATPTGVPGTTNEKRIWSIGGASCASDASGKLACWGDVDAAGRVTATGAHRAPSAALGLDHVVALTAHAALHDSGDVSFWSATGARTRVGTTGVVEISDLLPCGRRADGSIECYGSDQPCARAEPPPAPPAPPAPPVKGKKSAKATNAKPAKPAKPATPPGPRIEKLTMVGAKLFGTGGSRLCTVTTGARVQCLNLLESGCSLLAWGHLVDVVQVAGSCARLAAGSVRCWPADLHVHDSVAIAGVAHAIALAASGERTCAIVGEHAVACWVGTGAARTIDL